MSGLDLQYKNFTRHDGSNVSIPDYLNSGKWNHGLTKFGVDSSTANNLFSYWENHPYLKNLYQTSYANNRGGWESDGPFGLGQKQGNGERRINGFYDLKKLSSTNPFQSLKISNIQSDKNNSNFNLDGDKFSYTNSITSKLPFQRDTSNLPEQLRSGNAGYRGPLNTVNAYNNNPKYKTESKDIFGRILNDTFVDENLYETLSDEQKQFYGLSFEDAYKADPKLSASAQGINAAYNYRLKRKAKGEQTGFGAYAPKVLALAGAALGMPYLAALGGGIEGGKNGGGIGGVLTGGLTSYFATSGLDGLNGVNAASTPGINPNGFSSTVATGNNNVNIWDSFSGLFNGSSGNFDLGTISSVFNPNSSGGNLGDIFNSGGGIFDTINSALDSPLGQLGSDLFGAYLGNKEADEYTDRLRNAADGARFNPYNAQGPGGGVTYNNGQATTYLSPAMQALANQIYGSAQGNINAFNSYDPAEQASEQFNILENIAEPYRQKERDSLMSTLINQGVYNPEANQSSPGYWQPRYLEDSINASRDKNLFDSYNLAQNTATNVLNRGIGSTNLLNSINYGPLQYAGLGADLGRAGISGASVGIPYIQNAAEYDRNADSTIFNSLLNSLGRRV